MNGIWTSYLFRWTPPLRRRASGPAGSSKRALTFRTLHVCEYLRFWPLKVHQLEAGACQSSTARCWSHTHRCPCAIPGSRRQHTRIRRPALSRSLLASVWNGRRVIAMKKARKERHPPKKVLSYRCRDSGQERFNTANDHVIWVKYTIDIQIIYVIYDNLLLWMLIVWTHLNILVMKEMMIHVEGITPSPGCWKKLLLQHHDFQVLSSVMAL